MDNEDNTTGDFAKKESSGWRYTAPVPNLATVVNSPYSNSSDEEKALFAKILTHYHDNL